MPEPTTEVWYRIQDYIVSAGVNEWDESCGSRVEVRVDTYPVLSKTPKGVWLDLDIGQKRLVLHGTRKQWASPTEREAWEHFRARKRRQILILRTQLRYAEQALSWAEIEQDKRRREAAFFTMKNPGADNA